ncbi:DUF6531 domain-containing protein [Luteimonas gilva]|nr:DUF6531 domain-containing protein [Luteimonas gilva]
MSRISPADCRLQSRKSLFSGILLAFLLACGWLLASAPAFEVKAQATDSYAPIFKWAVDNWYQGRPQWHRRWFSTYQASYSDWFWYGEITNGPELPCGPGDVRNWVFNESYLEPGYNGKMASANYFLVECDGSGSTGPWPYNSSTRHWTCGDDYWREPWSPSLPEVCEIQLGKVDPSQNKGPKCPTCFGDPINPGVGNKFEYRVEVPAVGASPLEFAWTYNSKGASSVHTPGDMLGAMRSTVFSRGVEVAEQGGTRTAYVGRPDGNTVRFNSNGTSWVPVAEAHYELNEEISGWRFSDAYGNEEYFDTGGKLLKLTNPDGKTVEIAYDSAGKIESASDEYGRSLAFVYDADGRLQQLSTPDGQVLTFSYQGLFLSEVNYPGGHAVSYLYDESAHVGSPSSEGALTGVLEDGVRVSTTKYDSDRRAYATTLAGGLGAESATYVPSNYHDFVSRADIALANGANRRIDYVAYRGRIVPTSIIDSCSGCVTSTTAYTYDQNGYVQAKQKDGAITNFAIDSLGRETSREEGIDVANPSAGELRTTQTDWSSSHGKPTERRVYSAAGNLTAKSTWTYNSRGQTLTSTQTNPATSTTRTTTTTYCEAADLTNGTCPLLGW